MIIIVLVISVVARPHTLLFSLPLIQDGLGQILDLWHTSVPGCVILDEHLQLLGVLGTHRYLERVNALEDFLEDLDVGICIVGQGC